MPLRISGEPVPDSHRDRVHTPIWLDKEGGFRFWSAGLYLRALEAFEATLLLARHNLDAEARAHTRIGFDYLVAFAWVAADPSDLLRPMQISRYGFDFYEKQIKETSRQSPRERDVHDLALILEVQDKVPRLPSLRELCASVDHDWKPRLPEVLAEPGAGFEYWYSYLFRGASAFVHPTSRGIQPTYVAEGTEFVFGSSQEVSERLLEILVVLLGVQAAIAMIATPWLVNSEHPGYQEGPS
jgi:hypothetical protein